VLFAARFLKEHLSAKLNKDVFLDSDDLRDLSKLKGHVRNSGALVIVQSAEVLQRPWCLLEIYEAIEAKVPIIAINVAGKGYDFAEATNLLMHLDTELDSINPGACDLLRSEGVDPVDAAFKLSSVLPSVISLPFNSSASSNAIQAALADIAEGIRTAALAPITKNKAEWLKARAGGGQADTFTGAQHGDTLAATEQDPAPTSAAPAVAAAPLTPALALVPGTVPELPDVMSERPEMVAELRSRLLGTAGQSGTVSLSSVKKSKVSTHGQGGVGKTTMAVVVVNDPAIRGAFERIGWISVGQAPAIMEMQRSLFFQLTQERLLAKAGDTAETLLHDLQEACKGKHWLVVLDDVWDKVHEKVLNCVDQDSASRLLVTTRIRGLLQGCDEVSLNLLSPSESIDLLLRAGEIDNADEGAKAAGAQICELCGNLPLYLSICGGVILGYDDEPYWQTEVVEMLKDDRVALLDDGSGDNTVGRLVDRSLNMLKDGAVSAVFMALGVVPEDVLVKPAVVQLICAADEQVILAKGKVNNATLRRTIKTLLDRNLLQGSIANGVQFHDIVRDLVRARLGGADGIRKKQRAVVEAFVAACPADGWAIDDAVGQYAGQTLQQHMTEALLPDPLADQEAQAWLDASDDRLFDHVVVCSAANAIGHEALVQMAELHESKGELWPAAKRLVSASRTDYATAAGLLSEALDMATAWAKKACDLLSKCESSRQTNTLEVMVRAGLVTSLGFGNEWVAAGKFPRFDRIQCFAFVRSFVNSVARGTDRVRYFQVLIA
jgi:hypothetical protein